MWDVSNTIVKCDRMYDFDLCTCARSYARTQNIRDFVRKKTLLRTLECSLTHAHGLSYAHTRSLLRTLSIPLTHTCALERFSYAHSYARACARVCVEILSYAHSYARACVRKVANAHLAHKPCKILHSAHPQNSIISNNKCNFIHAFFIRKLRF